MTSKYLNQTINGWLVTDMVKTKGGHKSFILTKHNKNDTLLMTVRDNELTKLAAGKSMTELLAGKEYQVTNNIRVVQNTLKHI